MTSRFIFFGAFMVFIILMLAMDLGVFHKKDHVIKIKEAAIWTGIWVTLAMLFGLLLRFKAEWVHGITCMDDLLQYIEGGTLASHISAGMDYAAALEVYRKEIFSQYLAGYFLEETLSIDNIFVMIMIFMGFGIDQKYYHRVLFWGILGAIILRFIFIFLSAALIQRFAWILAIFGVVLVVSGIKMIFAKEEEEKIDTENHPVVKFFSKHFRLLREYKGHNFFVKHEGKIYATSLFLVLLVIEFSDIIFAVDSIPAIFSVTQDPYIVFFSNIFAILGLRSLFFMLSSIMNLFRYLKTGVSFLLIFIGVKMLLHTFLHIEIGTGISLCVILGILTVSILASILITKKENA